MQDVDVIKLTFLSNYLGGNENSSLQRAKTEWVVTEEAQH